MKFSLDTNAVIALLKFDPVFLDWLRQSNPDDFCWSSIVVHELYFGAYKSRRSAASLGDLRKLPFRLLDFDLEDARRSGELRAHLETQGRPIGLYDTLIAGQALARDLILVTRNTREFERVPGLRVFDWH